MPHLSKSITVDAPVEDVWKVYADYGAVNDWHPYFESAALVPSSPASGVGATRDCSFGPRSSIRETVTEWQENERMVIDIQFLSGPPMPIKDLVASVNVKPLESEQPRTDVTLTLDYETRWGPIGLLADRLMVQRMYLGVFRDMLDATKSFVETGETPRQLSLIGSGRKV